MTDFHTYGRIISALQCRHSKWTLGRRLSTHNFFWKQRIPKLFWKQTDRIFKFWTLKGSATVYATMKTLKPFELTWPPRKQPSNLWLFLVRLQRTSSIFCYQKTLWLGKLTYSKCLGLTGQHRYVIEDNTDTQRMQLHVMSFEVKELPRVGGGVMASTWERPGYPSPHLSHKSIALGYALRNIYINRTRLSHTLLAYGVL